MPTVADGRQAIEQGNFQRARLIFESILEENPRHEESWLELANVVTETGDKRICYETVLAINRKNQVARQALRTLEPEDDPTRLQVFQEVDDELAGDSTNLSTSPTTQEEGETHTAILVATGLLLSVVVFVIGSSLVFIVLITLTGQ